MIANIKSRCLVLSGILSVYILCDVVVMSTVQINNENVTSMWAAATGISALKNVKAKTTR